ARGTAGARIEDVRVTHAVVLEEALVVRVRDHRLVARVEPRDERVRIPWVADADAPRASGAQAAHRNVAAGIDAGMREAARGEQVETFVDDETLADRAEVPGRRRQRNADFGCARRRAALSRGIVKAPGANERADARIEQSTRCIAEAQRALEERPHVVGNCADTAGRELAIHLREPAIAKAPEVMAEGVHAFLHGGERIGDPATARPCAGGDRHRDHRSHGEETMLMDHRLRRAFWIRHHIHEPLMASHNAPKPTMVMTHAPTGPNRRPLWRSISSCSTRTEGREYGVSAARCGSDSGDAADHCTALGATVDQLLPPSSLR